MSEISIMRLPEVLKATGLSRSTLYSYVRGMSFPRPVKIGERSVGWLSVEIAEWIKNRPRT